MPVTPLVQNPAAQKNPATENPVTENIGTENPATASADVWNAPVQTTPTGSSSGVPFTARTSSLGPSAIRTASVDASLLPKLGGRALLDQLALLPTRGIARFVHDNPEVVTALLSQPPSARSVATWWSLISDQSRLSLAAAAPELVGNLEGLPTKLRDEANRRFLTDSIEKLRQSLTTLGRAELASGKDRLHMLEQIEASLESEKGEPERTLLSVDTAWPGRAAIVIGDLDTADYVSYLVPGMFFTVDRTMLDWTIISKDLNDEQVEWVHRLGRSDPELKGSSVATVAWIGYETPGIADITSLDLAEDGAKYISSSVNGLKQTRTGEEPDVTLISHSYGSTATLMALQDGTISVDSLVLIGSPGGAAQSVRDIGMLSDQVFVGEAAWDPVVNSAFFGSDPGADSFGAQTMSVEGGEDPITGDELGAASGHLGYFDPGTEAMRNMALIGLDRGDLVTGSHESVPDELLASEK